MNIIKALLVSSVLMSAAGCHGNPMTDISHGAKVVADVCDWIEEEFMDGAVIAICATAAEVSKFGKHPKIILAARHPAK